MSELRNHPFFAKIHWKNLELKRIEPPLKPHMDSTAPNREVGLDPWASVDGDDSNFEILSHSQQEVNFYYLYIYYYFYLNIIFSLFILLF